MTNRGARILTPDALLTVVVGHGGRLGVVGAKALLERLGIVVGPLDQGFAGDIVRHGLLGRAVEMQTIVSISISEAKMYLGGRLPELLVVAPPAGRVNQPAGDARDEEVVVDFEFDGVVELLLLALEHVIELLSLGRGSRESIEDEAGFQNKSESE